MKKILNRGILKTALSFTLSLVLTAAILPVGGLLTATAEGENTSVTISAAEIKAAVNVYGGASASSSGLSKADFDDRFETTEGGVIHKITELGSCGDVWSAQNEVVSSALYKAKKMRDFELKVRMINVDKNWAVLPRVIFGVQDPTAWINTSGGGYTAGLYNEGNSYLNGVFGGAYASNADPANYCTQNKFFSLWDAWYNLIVRVQGEKVTVTVEEDWCEPYSYEYDLGALGAEYRGGYIGFVFGTGVSKIISMNVTDLGGEVLNDVKSQLMNKDDILGQFDIYHSDQALSDNFTAAEFDNYFKLDENNFLTSAYDPYVGSTGSERWENMNNTITKALVKNSTYRNFEMSVQLKSAGWDRLPKLVFGATNPLSWVNREDGGYLVQLYNEGVINFVGIVNGEPVNLNDNLDSHASFQGLSYDFVTLKVRVENGVATVTVKTYGWADPNTYSYSFDLGENYNGGYVGFAAGPGESKFIRFSVTDLGGEADTSVKAIAVNTPDALSVPVLTFAEELNLPAAVSVLCDDGNSYDLPVVWDTSTYSRFVPGDYTFTGTLGKIINAEGKRVVPNGQTATLTVTVTGEEVTPILVACVGDSITYGDKAEAGESYPAVLQKLLGARYEVMNFGVCGATAQSDKSPYVGSTPYTNSLASNPDVVIMMLGTNDSWNNYWNEEQFVSDYTSLIEEYMYLENKPEVYLAISPACYIESNISAVTAKQREIAAELGIKTVDMYSFTENHGNWFADGVHPNAGGYALMARAFAKAVFGKAIKGDTDDNWSLNAVDLTAMKKILLGTATAGEGVDLDMNDDKSVNILDFIKLKKAIIAEA